MFFDPIYLFFPIPALGIVLWSIRRAKLAENAAKNHVLKLNGAEAARRLLDLAERSSVSIQNVDCGLTDFFDPAHQTVRLSTRVHDGRAFNAVAIAAIEAGHAIIEAPMRVASFARAFSRPLSLYLSSFSWVLFLASVVLTNLPFFLASVAALSINVALQCVLLPIEFLARRAVSPLIEECLDIDPEERALFIEIIDAEAYRSLPLALTGAFQETIVLAYHKLFK